MENPNFMFGAVVRTIGLAVDDVFAAMNAALRPSGDRDAQLADEAGALLRAVQRLGDAREALGRRYSAVVMEQGQRKAARAVDADAFDLAAAFEAQADAAEAERAR